jgi:hypothetical protein
MMVADTQNSQQNNIPVPGSSGGTMPVVSLHDIVPSETKQSVDAGVINTNDHSDINNDESEIFPVDASVNIADDSIEDTIPLDNMNNEVSEIIEPYTEVPEKIDKKKKKLKQKKDSKAAKLIDDKEIDNIKKDGEQKIKKPPHYYKIDISDIPSHVNAVSKFMNIHPEFFKTNVNKKFIRISDNVIYNVYEDPVVFHDNIHNIKGFITTTYTDKKFSMVLNIRTPIKEAVTIKDDKGDKIPVKPKCYINQIETYVLNSVKNGNHVTLYFYKILGDTIIKQKFYDQPIEQWKEDVKLLQEQFFLSNSKELLAIINNKTDTTKVGSMTHTWNNMLLYGPVGSGKSSFTYRTAMTLKMSIVSIDISLFLNKKKELYNLFYNQEFCLPNSQVKEPALNNVIIALEEFDDSMNKLLDIENIFKYKDILKKHFLENKNKELKEKAEAFAFKSDDYDTDKKIEITVAKYKAKKEKERKNLKNKHSKAINGNNSSEEENDEEMNGVNSSDEELTHQKMLEKMMLEDGFDMKNNIVMEEAKMATLAKRSQDNELNAINAELNSLIQSIDTDNKSNILRVNDMKELFNGTVPVQRIVIGTTNNLEGMKKAMPSMFRAGRFTAIPFPYLDWSTLNELTISYFNKNMTIDEFKIDIPTSEVIELAVKICLTKDDFSVFENELKALCVKT